MYSQKERRRHFFLYYLTLRPLGGAAVFYVKVLIPSALLTMLTSAICFQLMPQQSVMMLLKSLASFYILAAVAFAVPAQEKRIHHNADLSDHIHNDAHGFQYDHEAFLGKEEAKTFDQLTPEESKDKLA